MLAAISESTVAAVPQRRSGKRVLRHPEMPTLAYRYDIKIIGEVPQVVWDTARTMNALWNEMVRAHGAVLTESAAAVKDERKARFKSLTANNRTGELYQLAQTYKDKLPFEYKWHVYDEFQKAQRRFAKRQGGAPKEKHGLRSILLPYPLGDGGVSIDWLHQERRAHVAVVDAAAYRDKSRAACRERLTRGWFTVAGTRVPFEMAMDRPLPQGALIKRVALSGKLERPFDWRWSLVVSLQVPSFQALPKTGRVAGLDLGWREMGDYIRIGTLVDSGGVACEWRLRYDQSRVCDRKFRARLLEQGVSDLPLPRDMRFLSDFQARVDDWLEWCKEDLRRYERVEWPAEARQMMNGIGRMRAGGLRRLRRTLAEAGIYVKTLDEWYQRYSLDLPRLRAAWLDFIAARNYTYRVIAAWLATNYDVVAWENLGLKQLSEDEDQAPAIAASQKRRHWASLHVLRGYIREAMKKRGRDLRDYDPAYSTQTCHLCGGHIEPGAELMLVCERGHLRDQDVNAAENFLGLIEPELRAVAGISRLVEHSRLQGVVVPVKAASAKAA